MAIETTNQAHARASYAGAVVDAALEPGGPLHVDLSDLIVRARGIAMDALEVSRDANGNVNEAWPDDELKVEEEVAGAITERLFQEALHYLERVSAG
jgi:hypothetical protein